MTMVCEKQGLRKRIGWMVIDTCAMMMMMMMMMHQHDYDRNEAQCMLVDRYASQRLSSQNNSWILAEPTILQMRLHADASCLFLITFFRHMSGLGNVQMFAAFGFAFPQSLHLLFLSNRESIPQLDASLSRLGSGIECSRSIESEY